MIAGIQVNRVFTILRVAPAFEARVGLFRQSAKLE